MAGPWGGTGGEQSCWARWALRSSQMGIPALSFQGIPGLHPTFPFPKEQLSQSTTGGHSGLFQQTKVQLFFGKGPRNLGRCTELPGNDPASATLEKNQNPSPCFYEVKLGTGLGNPTPASTYLEV